jgi:hypothetical protein
MICFSCKKEIPVAVGQVVGRRDECPSCGADAHVCLNCAHYDRGSYNECKESQADYVKEKDRSNFCDYFTQGGQIGKAGPSKDDLLSAAEALFKKK